MLTLIFFPRYDKNYRQFIFINEQVRNKTQKTYDRWSLTYDIDSNPHILLEHDEVLRLVHANRNEKILDVACGTGKYTEEFYKKNAIVVGIDFSKKMLEIAKRKNPHILYKLADLRKRLLFPANSFDKVNCAQVLKHLRYRELKFALKEFHRVIKPAGLCIFSVTHPDMDWTGYKMKKTPRVDLPKESEITHHKFSDYLEAIEKAGFSIEEIKQLPIDNKIKHLLTPSSFKKVRGRYEIIIFKLRKKGGSEKS